VIRREDLASAADDSPVREAITALINHNTPMVIVGLGTLGRRTYWHDTHIGYRLAVTTAVAEEVRRIGGEPASFAADQALTNDVRHIARVIGEQVEVWAPGPDGQPVDVITAVKPR
jgi:hypothetical protein